MAALKGPGAKPIYSGAGLRIAIIHARWNATVVDSLVAGAKRSLLSAGVVEEDIIVQSVPGSYELPLAVQEFCTPSHYQSASNSAGHVSGYDRSQSSTSLSSAPFDAVIAVGVLIKGETMHFEYISNAVSQGLMRVQLHTKVPVVFGVLTVLEENQALERAGLGKNGKHNHGEDWGHAAVELGVKRRGWAQGIFL